MLKLILELCCCCCTSLLQCAKLPTVCSWECKVHSPDSPFLCLSDERVMLHSCFHVSQMCPFVCQKCLWRSNHPDWNRVWLSAVMFTKTNSKKLSLWLKSLTADVSSSWRRALSVCCIFCFWPACQKKKMSSDGQTACQKALPKTEDVTDVLLNQKPKRTKLSHCTPLDRVLIHVCALLD